MNLPLRKPEEPGSIITPVKREFKGKIRKDGTGT